MKRGLVAVLALSLTLGGCGGSDGEESTTSSAVTSSSGSPRVPGGSAGASGAPTAPGGTEAAKAAEKLGDCMRRQGVTLPDPQPAATLSPQERAKVRAALRSCAKSMSAGPDQPR
jgi:hypothetical protein